MNRALQTAYAAAVYRADLPAGRVEIRVGRRHPALDRVLTDHGNTEWAFLTAHNPRSARLTPARTRAATPFSRKN